MDKNKLIKELKLDEGFMPHEYKDTLGFSTIGYGRLIDKRKGGGITEAEADYLLGNDVERVWEQLKKALPWVIDEPEGIQQALSMMAFQMGVKSVTGFSTTLKLIRTGNYVAAANNAMESLWAKQTPNRARKVTDLIRNANKL
ncbi:MAG: glycoside hydrolase family protein [Ignavibacteria bacterium]